MKKYIFIIIALITLMLLLVFNSFADTKQKEYYIQQYKNIQQDRTSLIKEVEDLKNENNALKCMIDTYGLNK